MFTHVIVHYGEIGLKGRNRPFFEKRLVKNIEFVTQKKVKRNHGFLLIESVGENIDKLRDDLSHVFGIAWFAFVHGCKSDIKEIEKTVIDNFNLHGTVKVDTNRSEKSFPLNSMEVNKTIGSALVDKGCKISMKPDNKVYIDIGKESYVFFEKIKGPGGLPVGVSGKVLVLLSGGIDSPVAAHLMAKRGCECEFLHIHGLRNKKEIMDSKMTDILNKSSEYCLNKKLHIASYDDFYFAVNNLGKDCSRYEMLLFRKYIFLLAEKLAKKIGAKAIITGDNLGQVASQTIDNISSVSIETPIFRPLLGFDKEEIVCLAKKVGTYEDSIREYKDCCSIVAKHPETHAKKEIIKDLEDKINLKEIVEKTFEKIEVI
ncbi:tRNA uracil 4-sulfurtransferase ThiI [Candidatus Aenigmatarchaeota archaeon]